MRSETQDWKTTVALFFLGWLMMSITRQVISPIQAEILLDLGISIRELGLINSIFFIATVAIQIPAGRLGDKFRKSWILGTSFILYGAATIISGLSQSFLMLLLSRAATGFGQGFYYPNQFALSSEIIPPKKRILGNAVINSGNAIGIIIGVNLSAFIAFDLELGWRAAFYAAGIPTIVLGIVFALYFSKREKKCSASKSDAAATPTSTDSAVSGESSCSLMPPALIVVCCLVFCSIFAFFMLTTWLPLYLEEVKGFSKGESALLSSASAWLSIPASLLYAKLAERLRDKRPLVLVLFLSSALSIFGLVFCSSYHLLLTFMLVYGATGKIASDSIIIAQVPDFIPRRRLATVFGVCNFIGMSASIIATILPAELRQMGASWDAGFLIAGSILAAASFISLLMPTHAHK